MYREIFQHEIFKHELDFRLFMLILGNAVYVKEGMEYKGIHLQRGQWIRSYRLLARDLEYKEKRGYKQYGIATIKRSIDRLIKNGLVTVRETDNGTLFSVVNYDKYQGFSDGEEDSGTVNGTLSERHRNKTKKDKKDKEIKKEPTSQEKFGKKNLSNDADVESFVEILSDSNPFDKIPKKLIAKYINTIRFRRKTKRIATSIVNRLWEEWKQFDQEVVTYALWVHIEQYSKDKDENYTLGIMRNTDVHEARRKLIIMKNKNQSPQQTTTKPMSYWEKKQREEEEIERKRLAERNKQMKIQMFIEETGLHPMKHPDLLRDYLEGRVSLAELKERKWGS